MENQNPIIPYDKWPWWVKLAIIPSGSRIFKNSGQAWSYLLFYLAGLCIYFGFSMDSTKDQGNNPQVLSFMIFNILCYSGFITSVLLWVRTHSDPTEYRSANILVRFTLGALKLLIMLGPPYLLDYLQRHNL